MGRNVKEYIWLGVPAQNIIHWTVPYAGVQRTDEHDSTWKPRRDDRRPSAGVQSDRASLGLPCRSRLGQLCPDPAVVRVRRNYTPPLIHVVC